MKQWKLALVFVMSVLMTGCATNISQDSYSVDSVGDVSRTVSGVIVSARYINVQGTSQIGGLAGSLAGSVAGSSIGGGTRANILGAIGGAIIGAMAGSAIEKGVTAQKGVEYVVQTNSGQNLTLVQGDNIVFNPGDRVLVLYGQRARIVADTSYQPAPQQAYPPQ